jgi:hypothetical protein
MVLRSNLAVNSAREQGITLRYYRVASQNPYIHSTYNPRGEIGGIFSSSQSQVPSAHPVRTHFSCVWAHSGNTSVAFVRLLGALLVGALSLQLPAAVTATRQQLVQWLCGIVLACTPGLPRPGNSRVVCRARMHGDGEHVATRRRDRPTRPPVQRRS